MGFDVEVEGRARRTVRVLLGDHVDEASIHVEHGSLVVTVEDQAALLALITCLNDVGVTIERVRRVR